MKKINRKRKRIIKKYRYLSFRSALIHRISKHINMIIDEKLLYPEKDIEEIAKQHFERGIMEAWQDINEN